MTRSCPCPSRMPFRAVMAAVLCGAMLLAGCERPVGDAAVNAGGGVKERESAATDVLARFDAADPGAGAMLPADIARALSTDARVLDCPAGTRDGASAFAADWVLARRVDLDDDGHDDWVVQGRHACLAAKGEAGWWLYADRGGRRRLLLDAGRASALDVLATGTRGFHDLRLHRQGGAIEIRYQGDAYALPGRTAHAPAAGDDDPPLAAEQFALPPRGGGTSVHTVAGLLRIAPVVGAADGDAHVVRLGGQELLRTGAGGEFADFPLPLLLARYRGLAPFDEVLVIQQHMYGNACNGGPLWVLALRGGAPPVRSGAIDYCGGGEPVLAASAGALSITLPGAPASQRHDGVAAQRWEFRDGELRPLDPP